MNLLLLLLINVATTTPLWACGKKHPEQKQYAQAKKCANKCQKACCKKLTEDSKSEKKKCCGGDCTCSNSITIIADLPNQLPIDSFINKTVYLSETSFFYKSAFTKYSIRDIWQPPITLYSI